MRPTRPSVPVLLAVPAPLPVADGAAATTGVAPTGATPTGAAMATASTRVVTAASGHFVHVRTELPLEVWAPPWGELVPVPRPFDRRSMSVGGR